MDTTRTVILIDANSRRRAAISHSLAGSGLHMEPFETVEELQGHWSRAEMVLVHDEGSSLADLIAEIARKGQWLPVIAFAEDPTPARIVESILEGAVDYLAWPFAPDGLAEALDTSCKRAETVGNARLRAAAARGRVERLTRREREVLAGVAAGLSNRRIGEKLSISPRTVEIHRANMLTKMGATHSSEAIRIAIEAAIVD